MDDLTFKKLYGISEQDKASLIKRLSQDITWDDDDLVDSEQDVSNIEELDFETEGEY